MKPNSTKILIQFTGPLMTLLALLGAGIFLERPAVAQSTFTWTGGGTDGNWTTANNWGGTAPGSPQAFLNFAGSTRLINTNNFGAGGAGFQIYFKSGAGAFTNYGNSISFFDFSAIDPNIQNEGATIQTMNYPIVNGNTHGANGILNINLNASPAQGPLVFNGTISNLDATIAVRAINVSGGSTVRFNGALSDFSASGKLALTQLGAGTTILAASNSYSGATTVNAGAVEVDNGSGLGTSLLVLNGGGLSNNVSAIVNNNINLAAAATVGVGTSQTLTLGGVITNTGSLTKVGAGTLIITNANNYSGGTVANSTVMPKNNLCFGTGTMTANTGGQFFNSYNPGLNLTFTNAVTLNGGQLHTGGGQLATKNTWSGLVTLTASSSVSSDGGTTGNAFSGGLNMGNSGYTFTVSGNGPNDGFNANNFNSVISGGPNATFATSSSGVAYLNAANTFSGTNRSGFSLLLKNVNAMQNATLDMNAADNGTVTLINNAVIGALTGSRNLNMGGLTVSIGNNNSSTAFTGALTNSGSLIKVGTGTLTLSGVNTYSNITLVSAGKLALSGSGSLGSTNIIVGGGATFDVSGLTTPFALGNSVTLSNNASGAIINGTNNCSVGTISLRYDGVNPCFIQTNGIMTISSSTVIKVFNSGTALAAGTNTIIAAATSGNLGLVTGSVPSVVVTGSGVAAGNSSLALLQTNLSGGLDLVVFGPQTWTGASDTSWTTAGNWLSGTVPGSGSGIVFNGASVANLATVLNTNFNIYSLNVTNPTGPVSISGANTLTLAGGVNMSSASQNLSIAAPVIMSASQTWSVTNSRTLNVSSNVSGSAALTISGGGTVTLGASNSYTGGTTINGGTVQVGDNNALGAATTTLTFGAASNGKLQVNARTVTLASLSGDATATIENANGSPGALAINNSGSVAFPGVFQDGTGGGALALSKSGAGTLTLSATNTFSGGTTINAGIVTAATNNSLGSGAVTFNGGIRLLLANGVTITNAVTIGANAGAAANNLLQVSTGSSATLAGPITINNGAVAGGHLGSTDANGILNVQGFITVNNGVTLLQRAGTVVYSGGGNYTNVQVNQDKVVVGANNGIATSANFNTSIGASAAVTFDLNGFNQTIAGITRAGANAVNVTNSSTTADSTLTLNGVSTFAGSIVDSGSGTKVNLGVSGGTFTLTGTNRYRGNTVVSGGTLALSGGAVVTNSANIVVANGAVFDVSALTSAFTLAQALPGQTLSNSAPGAIISGNNNTASGTISLVYDGANPSFIITNGTMTLSTATAFKVNNTGAPLTPGTYKIVSKTTGGAVAGTVPSSVTVTGGPSAGTPSLAIVGGELFLTVGGASSISYTATGPFTYNGAAQSPTANFTGSTGAQTSAYVGVSVSYGPSANAPTNAGSYYVSNIVAADANYFGATNSQGFTINPLVIAVTADATNKIYGGVDPAFTYGYSPSLIAGDSFSGSLSRTAGETVGSYAINQGTLSLSANYSLSYISAVYTINPAVLSITASNLSKSYGQNVTFAGTEFSTSGLLFSDSVSSVTLTSTGAATNAAVGTYGITPSAATGTGLTNYTIGYNNGTLTVNPATLLVTADNTNRAYGAANPAFTASYSGFVNGETLGTSDVSGSPSLTTTANTNSAVGTYDIVAALGSLTATNYSFTFSNGTLTVASSGATLTLSSSSNPSGYLDMLTFTANVSPTNATGAVTFFNGATAFSTNSLVAGVAVSGGISSLVRGTNTITAIYLGDMTYVGSTNTLDQVVTNHSPIAGSASYTRNAAQTTYKIAVTNLLSNASDADGDTLTPTVGSSTNGATIFISGGFVLYSNSNAVVDQFTYTVTDGFGGTNSATITLNVDTTPVIGQSQIASVSGSTATLTFAGIPGLSYTVQRSTNVNFIPSDALLTTNAPAGGVFEFIDGSAPTPNGYYRIQFNP